MFIAKLLEVVKSGHGFGRRARHVQPQFPRHREPADRPVQSGFIDPGCRAHMLSLRVRGGPVCNARGRLEATTLAIDL
jgi:hypothetical protein